MIPNEEIKEKIVVLEITIDMMMESDLKGELTDDEYIELESLKTELKQLKEEEKKSE